MLTRSSFDAHSPTLKRLFGKPSRCALALWILDGHPTFYAFQAQTELSQLNIVHSAINGDLSSLVDSGLLTRLPLAGKVYYSQTESPLWRVFEELKRSLSDPASVSSGA